MTLQSLDDVIQSIEALSPGARVRLEEWFYTHQFPKDDESSIDRVAETAVSYEASSIPRYMTPEEYLEFEKTSEGKHEYVAGQIFAMSGPRRGHHLLAGNLFGAFFNHLRGGPCKPFIADYKIRIRAQQKNFFYYPDVMVACGPGRTEDVYLEDPKLVIEVLSRSSERRDRYEKAINYQQLATLEEYVLVAQDFTEVTVFRRAGDWLPHVATKPEAEVEFRSIGLTLPLRQIYEGVL